VCYVLSALNRCSSSWPPSAILTALILCRLCTVARFSCYSQSTGHTARTTHQKNIHCSCLWARTAILYRTGMAGLSQPYASGKGHPITGHRPTGVRGRDESHATPGSSPRRACPDGSDALAPARGVADLFPPLYEDRRRAAGL
jgi:hypothetical protein